MGWSQVAHMHPSAGNGTIDPLELRTCLSALGALLTDTDVEEMFEVREV